MSDRLKSAVVSKWTGALLLGVGTVGVAGGIALVVYYVVKKRQASKSESSRRPPLATPVVVEPDVPVIQPVQMVELVLEPVQEVPVREVVHEVPVEVVMEDKQMSAALGFGGPEFMYSQLQSVEQTDFAPQTYQDVYNEIQGTLKPVFDNSELYASFNSYIQVTSHATDRMLSLVSYLNSYEAALATQQPRPNAIKPDIEPMMDKMSSDSVILQVEVNALKALSEALCEFPSHIMRNAVPLTDTKRQVLIDLVLSTPHGVSKHVYMDQGPFNDPELHSIMTRMNFSIPSYQTKLTYTGPLSGEQDKLSLGLYLMLGTVPPS